MLESKQEDTDDVCLCKMAENLPSVSVPLKTCFLLCVNLTCLVNDIDTCRVKPTSVMGDIKLTLI